MLVHRKRTEQWKVIKKMKMSLIITNEGICKQFFLMDSTHNCCKHRHVETQCGPYVNLSTYFHTCWESLTAKWKRQTDFWGFFFYSELKTHSFYKFSIRTSKDLVGGNHPERIRGSSWHIKVVKNATFPNQVLNGETKSTAWCLQIRIALQISDINMF